MSELGLRSQIKRKFVVTTDSNHQEPIAANIDHAYGTDFDDTQEVVVGEVHES